MFAIPITESFDRTNPVVLRLVFGRRSGGGYNWRDAMPLIAYWTLPVMLILWTVGMVHARRNEGSPGAGEPLAFAADVANYLLLLTAFGAPAVGVGTRSRIDRSPLLADMLMSGLGWRRIVAGMQGRVVTGAFYSLALATLVAAFLAFAVWDPGESTTQGLNSSRLALITGFVPVLRPGHAMAGLEPWTAALMIASMVLNFGAGFLARASASATIGSTGPSPVALTMILVLTTMVGFVIRWKAPSMALATLGLTCSPAGLYLIHAVIELTSAGVRLHISKRAWFHVLRLGENQCRARLGWEEQSTHPG